MPEDRVVKVRSDLYQKAKELAEAEGITIADAITKLVEQGWSQPSVCELVQFRKVLESKGLTPPSRSDWLWGITNILPADMLSGTKLQPYAEARREAELRCSIGNELYDRFFGERSSEIVSEPTPPEATEPEPILPTDAAPSEAEAGGEGASPPAEVAEQAETEPAEVIKSEVE